MTLEGIVAVIRGSRAGDGKRTRALAKNLVVSRLLSAFVERIRHCGLESELVDP